MTEQDLRRLSSVAALYADVDAAGAERLRKTLAKARLLPASKIPRRTVTMNSRVSFTDVSGNEHELSLVYPWDEGAGRVSVTSLFGCSMLGAAIGTATSDDERELTVAAIPYQPEAAGDHHL
jgi:regulator of nucleoside diphosphate kinase